MWTIGQLAQSARTSIDSIRFYESKALLLPTARTAAGYRLYDEVALRRLRLIRRARELGFALDEIRALLALAGAGGSPCDSVRGVAWEKKRLLDKRIRELRRMSKALGALIAGCPTESKANGDCPILAALFDGPGGNRALTPISAHLRLRASARAPDLLLPGGEHEPRR